MREFCNTYDYVASSGGIGPTHDDVTLEGASLAFNKKLIKHDQAISYFKNQQEQAGRGSKISDIQLKMLCYPESAQVYFAKPLWLPMIRIDNFHIFCRVSQVCSKLLETWSHVFVSEDKFFREIIYINGKAKALSLLI